MTANYREGQGLMSGEEETRRHAKSNRGGQEEGGGVERAHKRGGGGKDRGKKGGKKEKTVRSHASDSEGLTADEIDQLNAKGEIPKPANLGEGHREEQTDERETKPSRPVIGSGRLTKEHLNQIFFFDGDFCKLTGIKKDGTPRCTPILDTGLSDEEKAQIPEIIIQTKEEERQEQEKSQRQEVITLQKELYILGQKDMPNNVGELSDLLDNEDEKLKQKMADLGLGAVNGDLEFSVCVALVKYLEKHPELREEGVSWNKDDVKGFLDEPEVKDEINQLTQKGEKFGRIISLSIPPEYADEAMVWDGKKINVDLGLVAEALSVGVSFEQIKEKVEKKTERGDNSTPDKRLKALIRSATRQDRKSSASTLSEPAVVSTVKETSPEEQLRVGMLGGRFNRKSTNREVVGRKKSPEQLAAEEAKAETFRAQNLEKLKNFGFLTSPDLARLATMSAREIQTEYYKQRNLFEIKNLGVFTPEEISRLLSRELKEVQAECAVIKEAMGKLLPDEFYRTAAKHRGQGSNMIDALQSASEGKEHGPGIKELLSSAEEAELIKAEAEAIKRGQSHQVPTWKDLQDGYKNAMKMESGETKTESMQKLRDDIIRKIYKQVGGVYRDVAENLPKVLEALVDTSGNFIKDLNKKRLEYRKLLYGIINKFFEQSTDALPQKGGVRALTMFVADKSGMRREEILQILADDPSGLEEAVKKNLEQAPERKNGGQADEEQKLESLGDRLTKIATEIGKKAHDIEIKVRNTKLSEEMLDTAQKAIGALIQEMRDKVDMKIPESGLQEDQQSLITQVRNELIRIDEYLQALTVGAPEVVSEEAVSEIEAEQSPAVSTPDISTLEEPIASKAEGSSKDRMFIDVLGKVEGVQDRFAQSLTDQSVPDKKLEKDYQLLLAYQNEILEGLTDNMLSQSEAARSLKSSIDAFRIEMKRNERLKGILTEVPTPEAGVSSETGQEQDQKMTEQEAREMITEDDIMFALDEWELDFMEALMKSGQKEKTARGVAAAMKDDQREEIIQALIKELIG